MAYGQRDMSGALFKNEKEGHENWPDMAGSIMVAGKMYWIKAWTKQGAKGRFLSLAVTEQEEKPQESKPPVATPTATDQVADDLPF